jgi:hypothetical protein
MGEIALIFTQGILTKIVFSRRCKGECVCTGDGAISNE